MRLLREATAGFVGITDMPGICFLPELMELYPDAQVILPQRDQASWWASLQMLARAAQIGHGSLWWALLPVPGWRWFPSVIRRFNEQ